MKRTNGWLLCIFALALLFGSGQANAQSISLDHVDGLYRGDTLVAGDDIKLTFRYQNPTANNLSISNGYRVYSPDGAAWSWVKADTIGLTRANFELGLSINYFDTLDHSTPDTVGIIGAKLFSAGLAAGYNNNAVTLEIGFNDGSSAGKHICVDSSWFRPGGTWKWAGSGGISAFPAWSGPHCYYIKDTLQPPPALVVTPDSLGFTAIESGANPVAQSFVVSEQNGSAIAYSAAETAAWLSLGNATGNTPAQVVANVDITGLAAGTYTENVAVTSSAGNKTVKVTLVVDPRPKILAVAPDTLRFTAQELGTNPDPQNFNVTESGGAAIAYTASESVTWLSLTNPSGTTPGIVGVNVNIAGVTAGSYTDLVTVASAEASNSPQLVVIELTVTPSTKTLVVAPDTLKFTAIELGPNPPSRNFAVTSTGGSVDYSAVENADWFALTNASGNTPQDVAASVTIAGLIPGTYTDIVTFSSTEATNSPIVRVVQLTVVARPKILVTTPDTLYFSAVAGGSNPLPQTFAVSEQGGANIPYQALEGVAWITLGNASGMTPDLVGVNVDITGVSAGTYTANISVSSTEAAGSNTVVAVLTVTTCPTLTVFPAPRTIDVYVGSTVTLYDTLRLMSTGGPLNWTIVDTGRFHVTILSGTTYSAVPAYFSQTFPDTGSFVECIVIEHDGCGSPVSYCVTVNVAPRPCAQILTPDSLLVFNVTQGDSLTTPVMRPVFVMSSDNLANFAYAVSSESAWVHINPTSGTTPDSVIVSVDPTGMLPGTFFADLRISTEDANVCEPKFRTVMIMLNVADSTANQFCAWVVDTNGVEIPGAYVDLYTNFPDSTTWMDRQISAANGVVWFQNFPAVFDLFATKAGYYPAVAEDLTFGSKGVMLVLRPLRPIVTTSQWVDYYCDQNLLNDYPLPAGSVVEATEPGGMIVGQFYVTEFGKYGFMPVYRANDTLTDTLGAMTGDVLTFWVNGQMAIADGDVTYPATYDRVPVCLNAGGVIQKDCELVEGWNLVSWNIDTPVDFLPDVLASISGCVEVVLGFEGGGLTYDPTLPQFSTLWYADHLSGYWIKIKPGCSATLSLTGIPVPANTAIRVYHGWNLVSYLPGASMTPADALASLGSSLTIAYGFDNGIQIYRPTGGQFNTLTSMSSCFGYWVKVASDGYLTYPGGVGPLMVAVENPNNVAARLAAPSDVTPTMNWVNLYSSDLRLDGQAVKAGSEIGAYTESGVKVGSFTMTKNGTFGFMPVYADNSGDGLKAGETFVLKVNGVKTNESFTYGADGDRMQVTTLTAKTTDGTLPSDYSLNQNYPNPFNPTTTISFALPVAGRAKLEVYNILGVLVATPFDGEAAAGTTAVEWDGKNVQGESVASGVYLYRLTSGGFSETRKMMLLK